mgnify:CR=1 FL=1
MNFLKLADMDLEGKKVIVRVDFNVPIKNGMVEDDTRLKATIPTINYLLEKNCKIILNQARKLVSVQIDHHICQDRLVQPRRSQLPADWH